MSEISASSREHYAQPDDFKRLLGRAAELFADKPYYLDRSLAGDAVVYHLQAPSECFQGLEDLAAWHGCDISYHADDPRRPAEAPITALTYLFYAANIIEGVEYPPDARTPMLIVDINSRHSFVQRQPFDTPPGQRSPHPADMTDQEYMDSVMDSIVRAAGPRSDHRITANLLAQLSELLERVVI